MVLAAGGHLHSAIYHVANQQVCGTYLIPEEKAFVIRDLTMMGEERPANVFDAAKTLFIERYGRYEQPLQLRALVFVPATCHSAITAPGTGVWSGDLPYRHYSSGHRCLFRRLALQPLQHRAPVFVRVTCPTAISAPGTGVCSSDLPYSHYSSQASTVTARCDSEDLHFEYARRR